MPLRSSTRGTILVAVAVFASLTLGGCASGPSGNPLIGSASPTSTATSTPSSAPTSSDPPLGKGPSALSCAQGFEGTGSGGTDSGGTDSGGAAPEISGAFDGRVQLYLLSTGTTRNVPLARDVNLTVPGDFDWLFLKTPFVLAAGAGAITVSVPDDGQQFLALVPDDIWTSGTPPDLAPWSQTSISIQPCPDNSVSFLGGVLARAADHCFTIRFESDAGAVDESQVRLNGRSCDT